MTWPEPPEGKDLPLRRATNRGIWAPVVAFLILGVVYSTVTPLFEASDELWHYPFVQHLADGGGLPVQDPAAPGPWRQQGGQPPLYYWLASLLTRWAPDDDLAAVLRRNPHADIGIPRPDGNVNMVVPAALEAFPYRGGVLAVHLARWFSVVLGTLTVLLSYGIGLEVLPRRPELALAGAGVVALTPMFLFISGSVNNDNLVVALASISLWLLLRLLRLPPTPGRWALLGGVIGLAGLSKVSALGLLPLTALALAWLSWRRRDWKLFFWGGACVVGAAALVAGWWYWRNWRLYDDPLAFNVFVAIVGERFPQPTLRQLLGEWRGFVMAYWGFFGGVNVPAPDWFYRAYNGLALLGAGGLVVGVVRVIIWGRGGSGGADAAGAAVGGGSGTALTTDTAFRLFLVTLWPLIVMAGLVRWTMLTVASQGRLLFPAIASLSYLMVLGWASVVPQTSNVKRETSNGRHFAFDASRLTFHVSRFTLLAPIALMAALAIWAPFGVIAPTYARPPLLAPAEEAAIPHRLDLSFAGKIQLLGYQIGASEVRPGEGLAVTLYWRALAPMTEDYSVFVHLVSENDLIIGQRDMYPGRGLFPTSQWQPGQAIADTYVIPVSPAAFSPSRAVLVAGLYRLASGERLPLQGAQGQAQGDHVRFGQVLVRAEPRGGIANPLHFNLDNQAALVGYDLDRTALRPGETLRLTLYWQALAPMARDYTVFAQVVGPNHTIWAQQDAWPLNGAAPTSGWRLGQLIADPYDLTLKPETPAGVYELHVGMYLGETMERLAVLGPSGHAQDNRVLLNPIRVVRP